MGEPSSLSPSSRMGLASISWNSVRVFSKLRNGLFRVLYQQTRFGTARRIAYAHSIVGTSDSGTQSHKRCCAAQGSPLWVIDYHLNPANGTIWKYPHVAGMFCGIRRQADRHGVQRL